MTTRHSNTTRRRLWTDFAVVSATATAVMAATACSTTPGTGSTHVTPAHFAAPLRCHPDPANAPMPNLGASGTVPETARISVTLTGVPAGTVVPGAAPTEVEVTVCNDSPVAYPAVGVVLVLDNCSCVPGGSPVPRGTVERFDTATGEWVPTAHPAAGTGMDFLAGYGDVRGLPKGTEMALRYRITLDSSMTAGEGGVTAAVVIPEPLTQIGGAYLAFRVSD